MDGGRQMGEIQINLQALAMSIMLLEVGASKRQPLV